MTTRTNNLRNVVYEAPYHICIERAKYWTESYKETEGLHPAIRQAKTLQKTLENISIFILDEEQIIWHRTSQLLGAILSIERGDVNYSLIANLRIWKERIQKPFQISEEDENVLMNEILPYWSGETVSEKKVTLWKQCGLINGGGTRVSPDKLLKTFGIEWAKSAMQSTKREPNEAKALSSFAKSSTPLPSITALDDQGHLVVGHNNLLKWGYNGIKKRAQEKLIEVNEYLNSLPIQTNGGSILSITNDISTYNDYNELE